MTGPASAAAAGTIEIGGDLVVRRMGYGAMRVTGDGIWGEPADREGLMLVLGGLLVPTLFLAWGARPSRRRARRRG